MPREICHSIHNGLPPLPPKMILSPCPKKSLITKYATPAAQSACCNNFYTVLDGSLQNAARAPPKLQAIVWNVQNTKDAFRNGMIFAGTSLRAMPATRKEVPPTCETSNVTIPIGMAKATSARTIANGCDGLPTAAAGATRALRN